MAVAMMLVCISSTAQEKRMMAFQTVMAMHDTTYKNLIKDGKYIEAIAPLTTLINILDTTTICQETEISPEMIKAAKADYLYDQACCFALTKQKKLALVALGKSVDSGYKRYDNMLNDNDLASLRKDKKYQALLAEEYYLDYYMAKNLYYFVCKKYSRFNPESDYRPNPAEEDIRLIPVGFVNNNWKCDTTTDPDFFWAKPKTE